MSMVESQNDDLSRNAYCVLGVPVDDVDFATTIHRIEAAANRTAPFLISTPNLNYLVNFQSDAEFRESLLVTSVPRTESLSYGLLGSWASRSKSG